MKYKVLLLLFVVILVFQLKIFKGGAYEEKLYSSTAGDFFKNF